MARYEHPPIYRAAFDLAVHIERIVKVSKLKRVKMAGVKGKIEL